MNKTNIEWCDYTWNPIVGCANGCSYCYAKEMNKRFKFIPDWDKPQFFPDRLTEPSRLRKPSTIFVGSMCDIFSKGVSKDWVKKIIMECVLNPQHKFMFLTKNPTEYAYFPHFPENCWLGFTMEKPTIKYWKFRDIVKNINAKSFVSIEPIMDKFGMDLSDMDLVIVGAMTGKNPVIPQKEWIDSIKHHNIFYKSNIKRYL